MSLTDEVLEKKINQAVDFLVRCNKHQMETAIRKLKVLQGHRVSNFSLASCGITRERPKPTTKGSLPSTKPNTTGSPTNVGPRTLHDNDTD